MAEADKRPADGRPAEKAAKPCVICGKPRDPKYDPFCSKRCADVDLHRWLTGSYGIEGSEKEDGGDGDER